jgi:hypothetical protein
MLLLKLVFISKAEMVNQYGNTKEESQEVSAQGLEHGKPLDPVAILDYSIVEPVMHNIRNRTSIAYLVGRIPLKVVSSNGFMTPGRSMVRK